MDVASVIGLAAAFGLLGLAVFLGGSVVSFVDLPSILLVVGGTVGAAIATFPMREFASVFRVVGKALGRERELDVGALARQLLGYAMSVRRDGILILERQLKDIRDPFLAKGVQLLVDGMEPEAIRLVMNTEMEYIAERHDLGADLFTTMGTVAPAMGLIGTLVGLVQMLRSMDDPANIGPAMALALLTTFYGAVLTYLVFNPIAGKLRAKSRRELLAKGLITEGVLSLAAGDNPWTMELKLNAYLSPSRRRSILE